MTKTDLSAEDKKGTLHPLPPPFPFVAIPVFSSAGRFVLKGKITSMDLST